MKIIVTGASGRIGFELARYFLDSGHKVICTFLTNPVDVKGAKNYRINLIPKNSVTKLIKNEIPDVVVNTVAMTNVDLCETNREEAEINNVQIVRNIVNGCKQVGCKIVQVSTSFVFGSAKGTLNEDDTPNPINHYGKTKLEGEKVVINSGLHFLVLRTDQPYNWIQPWQKENHVTRVLKKLNSGAIVKEITDWYNNPTFIPDFTSATEKLLETEKDGIYHLVGSDYLNRYEWSLIVAETFGKNKNQIVPIDSSELNLLAKRPNINLSNKKVCKDTGIRFVGVKSGLDAMLKNMGGSL